MQTQTATITKTQYLVIIWVLASIALGCLLVRIWIRLKLRDGFKTDDLLVVLAMTCLLASDIVKSVMVHRTYIIEDVQIHHAPKPPDYEKQAESYAKYQWAVAYLFFTGIWAVKGSFLAFYEGLTRRLTIYRRAWSVIVAITISTYIGSLFAYAFLDGMRFKTNLKNEAIKYQFSADLVTDIFITILPLSLAWNSRIPTKQKIILVGVFSMSLIITLFSIIRFALNSPSRGTAGPSWLQSWSAIEQSVSLIVACLASFRALAIKLSRNPERSSSPHKPRSANSSAVRKIPSSAEKLGFSHIASHEDAPDFQPPRSPGESMNVELFETVRSRDSISKKTV